MKLLLDLGHSRLKWALDGDPPLTVRALDWREAAFSENLARAWQSLGPSTKVLGAASRDHPGRALLSRQVQQRFGMDVEWLVSPPRLGQVSNAYAHPAQLGIDRFLALLAAWDAGLAPCIIADCGTALTLDALAADGSHLGGVIVPGVEVMLDGLRTRVPLLAGVPDGEIVDCARNTADALQSGCAHAMAGTIERFHRRLAPRLGSTTALLLCGGGADSAAAQVDLPATIIEHAVLRGMQVWARECAGGVNTAP